MPVRTRGASQIKTIAQLRGSGAHSSGNSCANNSTCRSTCCANCSSCGISYTCRSCASQSITRYEAPWSIHGYRSSISRHEHP